MRRKVGAEADSGPPREVLVFEGHQYATEAAWMAAFDEWHSVRDTWFREHGWPSHLIPSSVVNGSCPFDYGAI